MSDTNKRSWTEAINKEFPNGLWVPDMYGNRMVDATKDVIDYLSSLSQDTQEELLYGPSMPCNKIGEHNCPSCTHSSREGDNLHGDREWCFHCKKMLSQSSPTEVPQCKVHDMNGGTSCIHCGFTPKLTVPEKTLVRDDPYFQEMYKQDKETVEKECRHEEQKCWMRCNQCGKFGDVCSGNEWVELSPLQSTQTTLPEELTRGDFWNVLINHGYSATQGNLITDKGVEKLIRIVNTLARRGQS